MAIQRAEDKTAQMQARAGAIDELLASGALDDPTGMAKDDITLELEQLASTSEVENELARMKASLGAGPVRRPGDRGPAHGPQGMPSSQATPQTAPAQSVAAAAAARSGAAGRYQPPQQYEPQTQPNAGDLR